LGWVQFERLCNFLVHLEGLDPEWEGRADVGRFATLGETIVAVVWVRPFVRTQLARSRLIEQLAATLVKEAHGRRCDSLRTCS
jgi:hypothetical protein